MRTDGGFDTLIGLASARLAALLLAIVASTWTASARADDTPHHDGDGDGDHDRARVALAWSRAPGAGACISPEELVDRIRARAPAEALVTLERPGADFVVMGRIAPEGAGFRTELELRDAHGQPLGERKLDTLASSCRTVDDSLVLALLLLVGTHVRALPPAPEPPGAPPELVPPLRDQGLPRQRSAPLELLPSPRPAWRFDVGAGAALAVGLTPKPTVGATVFGAITPPHVFPFVLRGTAYPFGVDALTVPGEGISIRGFEIGADACPLGLTRGRFEGLVCAGARASFLSAEPLGPQSSSGALSFFALPLRMEVRSRLPNGLVPYVAVAGLFSPLSPAFVYRANGETRTSFAVPHVTVELELGLAWRAFP